MLGVFAQFERETIIDRVISGMEREAARGEWPGGYRPHGYELDHATARLVTVDAEAAVPPLIFDLYVRERLGARGVANVLNERGYRKAGKPWSTDAVLIVLRNRVYLGEIYFRGTWYRADQHHPALVDADLFEQAQQILIARGDDHAKRASSNSEYTLAGLITCDRCGKRFVGTAANTRRYRYRYYTCFTRHRYGPEACGAERLPADELEQKVLDALVDTYRRTDLIDEAVTIVASAAARNRDTQQKMRGVDGELAAVTAKIDRYLTAFENRTMDDATCGRRITDLRVQAEQLQRRRDELIEARDATPEAPNEDDLDAIREGITAAIDSVEPGAVKRIMERLVHDVRVRARDSVKPWFKIPGGGEGVRTLSGSVRLAGFEPATRGLEVRRSIH